MWIDDLRDPFDGNWIKKYSPIGTDVQVVWVMSYEGFVHWINNYGMPDAICFDHDLGGIDDKDEKTGLDCAKYLVSYCMDKNIDVCPFNVHSSNPVGAKNIRSYLNNYHHFFINDCGGTQAAGV